MMGAVHVQSRMRRASILVACITLIVGGCNPTPAATVGPPQPTATLTPSAAPTAAPTVAATPILTPAVTSPIVGTWTRTIRCEDALAAFHDAGLDDQIPDWVVGNFVGENATAAPGHECDNAKPPEKHSHFFTAAGEFGSLDANGEQVDEGSYKLLDADTLSFPSAANDFGYDGGVTVDFLLDGDAVTFTVTVPDPCTDDCRVAFGWALSAFDSPTSWTRSH